MMERRCKWKARRGEIRSQLSLDDLIYQSDFLVTWDDNSTVTAARTTGMKTCGDSQITRIKRNTLQVNLVQIKSRSVDATLEKPRRTRSAQFRKAQVLSSCRPTQRCLLLHSRLPRARSRC